MAVYLYTFAKLLEPGKNEGKGKTVNEKSMKTEEKA